VIWCFCGFTIFATKSSKHQESLKKIISFRNNKTMKTINLFLTTTLTCILICSCELHKQYSDYPISMVEIKNVELTDSFWLPKIKTIQNTTIAFGFEKCIREGRLENFLIAGGKKKGKTLGKMPFDDSDIYKIIEGASNSLISAPNKELDAYLDSVISIIKIGQEPDGYLSTWVSIDPNNPPAPWVQKTGQRWTREISSHELYNAGHMYEAAVAHYLATGKRSFLEIAIKNADLVANTFGPGKITLPPGHQIIETGLVKLYQVTQNNKYLKLAKYFLDLRGDSTTHKLYGAYNQDDKPVTCQTEIAGHAVRAVYMYAGMTDIGVIYNDSAYLKAVNAIWGNMVTHKMYITGGIGAKHEGESLGKDDELPNLTSYSETCASIGDVLWNNRLFRLSGDAKYYDVIERTLYNGLIAGISLDGKNFFYVNPLEADGKFKFNQGAMTRQPWFDCSCCPTNLIRFIPSIPGLIYALRNDELYVNLYVSNKATIAIDNTSVKIEQQCSYPWHGDLTMIIEPENLLSFTLKFRIPGWAHNQVLPGSLYSYTEPLKDSVVIMVNGQVQNYEISEGYALISRDWEAGDKVEISLPMAIRRVVANEKVKDDQNLTAIEYGPFVYCLEGIDNNNQLGKITLPDHANLKLEKQDELPDGVYTIVGNVPVNNRKQELKITAIPYYAWSNRGAGTMKVWLPRY
jgi:uncharacterized protein